MTAKSSLKHDFRLLKNTRVLTISAMLTTMSVVIGILCKNFLTFNIYYRITFENLPVILSGVLFGPFVGAAVAVCADIISCLCSANPVVNPIISLGALCVGFLSGYVSHRISYRSESLRIGVSVTVAHLIGQVIVKSIGKILWYGMPWFGVFLGLGVSVIAGTVEFFAIRALLKSSGVRSELGKAERK